VTSCLGECAHGGVLLGPTPHQLVRLALAKLGDVPDERLAQGLAGCVRIDMRASDRLLDYFVDQLEPQKIFGGDLERLRRPLPLTGILPENGGASLG